MAPGAPLATSLAPALSVRAVDGIGEIEAGDDLPGIVLDAVGAHIADGDIVVVTSKVVSKAEGRTRPADEHDAAITAETVRVVATRETPTSRVRIVENRLGIVAAAAGIDRSNTAAGTILLLPLDPDASARAIAARLREATGRRVGVIVTDTLGRAWRVGQTDVAIGAAAVRVVDDLRGTTDAGGAPLAVTMPCVADEIAGAAELVLGKNRRRPVAIVTGRGDLIAELDEPGARSIVRSGGDDMFRLGTAEAIETGRSEGYAAGLAAGRAGAERAENEGIAP